MDATDQLDLPLEPPRLSAPLGAEAAPARALDAAALLRTRRRERTLERSVHQHLDLLLGRRQGRLSFTRNRSTLLSTRRSRCDAGRLDVRLHHRFVTAPIEVLRAAARICLGRGRGPLDTATLRRWFEHAGKTAPSPLRAPRPILLVARGAAYNLESIRTRLHRALLLAPGDGQSAGGLSDAAADRAASARLTWGAPPPRARRCHHSILLGSYHEDGHLVRIHPVLDQDWVPAFVVELVVYHELLHAALGSSELRGRRRVLHGPEFRRHERRHPRFPEAEAWIEQHLPLLLRGGKRPVG